MANEGGQAFSLVDNGRRSNHDTGSVVTATLSPRSVEQLHRCVTLHNLSPFLLVAGTRTLPPKGIGHAKHYVTAPASYFVPRQALSKRSQCTSEPRGAGTS